MEITLSIQSIHDLKKLEKYMFFYRSILGRFIHFKSQDSYLPIDCIVKALNIKNRRKRITYIYDTLCKQIDTYYQDKNLCDFQHDRCFVQRREMKYKNGCCRLCKYFKKDGCSTSNFTCKMFYCVSAQKKMRPLEFSDLPLLKCFSIRQRFLLRHDFFSSREDIISDLWWESIFINLFRIYPRFISNIILKRR